MIVAAVWGFISLSYHSVSADGGGWPSATPTQTSVAIQVITQAAVGQDTLIATQTPAELEGAAPLPDAPISGDQLLPNNSLLAATSTSSLNLANQTSGASNTSLFLTAGVLLIVILSVGFIVFRLRA
jgi:hypothetical protein